MSDPNIEVVPLSRLAAAKTDGAKFTRAQREENRDKIAALRLRGFTFQEIGERLGMATSYAYTEFKVVEQRWRHSARQNLIEFKARELARIDALEEEAWRAYERSQRDSVEQEEGFVFAQGERQRDSARAKRRARDGEAKWLGIVMQCIDRRIKLLGLDAPDLMDVSVGVSVNPPERLPAADRMRALMSSLVVLPPQDEGEVIDVDARAV